MSRVPIGAWPAAVAFATCLLVVYATEQGSFWISDCGNKALVAQRLLDTGYREIDFVYPGAAVDPGGQAFPMGPGFCFRRDGGWISGFPLALSALSAPLLGLLGPPGLRVAPALGVAISAWLLTSWLAPALGRRRAVVAGLVLGVATPLFFYGVTVWEHSLTVALGLAAWRVLTHPSPARLCASGFLVGIACWFREELALMGVALACACHLQWRRPAVVGWLLAGAAPPGLALLVFNHSIYGTAVGPHLAMGLGTAELVAGVVFVLALSGAALRFGRPERVVLLAFALAIAGSLGVALALRPPVETVRLLGDLISGTGWSDGELVLLCALGVAGPAIGWIAVRRDRRVPLAIGIAVTAGLSLWLTGVLRHWSPANPLQELTRYNGLMVQMPLACLAGAGLAWMARDPRHAPLRVGATAGCLFIVLSLTVAVALGRSFGVHWGPRVLLPGMPALVALALVGLDLDRGPSRGLRIAVALLVLAGVVSSVRATWFLSEQKREAARVQEHIAAFPQPVVVTWSPYLGQQLAALWDRKQLLWSREPNLLPVVQGLQRSGVRKFLLLAEEPDLDVDWIDGVRCRVVSRHRGRHIHLFDMDFQGCDIRAPRRRSSPGPASHP